MKSNNHSYGSKLTGVRIKKLMAVAAGREPADKLIRGINLVNVHLPRIEEEVALAIVGDRIAAIGPDLDNLVGPRTEVIDGQSRLAVPGMIDPHTHLDSIFTVRNFARLALMSGNTTVVTEMAMMANAGGMAGLEGFMAEASNLPMRVFFVAPPLIPPFPDLETSAGLSYDDFMKVLKRSDCLGVGETYWRPALDLPDRVMARFAAARQLKKSLEGHAAGARGPNLTAYRAGGITSCHESTTSAEAFERLALGMAVQVREGYIRSEVAAMADLAAMKDLDTRRLMLCSDLASPEMLIKTGVMNEIARRAMKAGFEPLKAIQMVTINPADYFGLDDLGRLSPGALADLLLVDDIRTLNPSLVMTGGRVVMAGGRLTVDFPDFKFPAELYRSFKLRSVQPGHFALSAPSGPVRVRVVAAAGDTITKEEIVEVNAVRNEISADPARDLLKLAVFNKHSPEPQGTVGLVKNLGFSSGAVASSLLWDTNNLLVAGCSDQEMALAANRLLELKGGMVVVKESRVLAEVPMPVAGLISEKPVADIMAEGNAFEKACFTLGSTLNKPFLTFQTLSFTGLPFLRLTDRGLVDVRQGKFVSLII